MEFTLSTPMAWDPCWSTATWWTKEADGLSFSEGSMALSTLTLNDPITKTALEK